MIFHAKIQIHSIRQKARAFTLIELLVVVTIIAALAVLGLTSTRSLKRSADQTACTSNLRQIGAAILAYTGENNGVLPGPMSGGVRAATSAYSLAPANRNSLIDYIAPYIGIPPLKSGESFYSKTLTCPAGTKALAAVGKEAKVGNYFIHLATYLDATTNLRPFGYKSTGSTTLPPFRLSNVPYPSRTLALVDEDNVLISAPSSPSKPAHEVSRNVLFIDGHVASVPLSSFVWQEARFLEVKQ